MTPLVIVADGTLNPAGPRTVEAIAVRLRFRLPEVPVRTAYVDHVRPSLGDVLADLDAAAVIVPLLLAAGALGRDAAGLRERHCLAEPLGPDRLLADAMRQRLSAAGARPRQPVLLVAAGSTDPATQGHATRAAQLLEQVWGGPVRAAHLTGRGRRMAEALTDLRARDESAVPAVAPWLVAPGHFHTKARGDARSLGLAVVADVLGDHPQVAEAVARRYRGALAHRYAESLA